MNWELWAAGILAVLGVVLVLGGRRAAADPEPKYTIHIGSFLVSNTPVTCYVNAFFCFALACGLLWLGTQGGRTQRDIGEYFPVYPNARLETRVPVAVQGTMTYLYRTRDTADQVAQFYRDAAARNAWTWKDSGPASTRMLLIGQEERQLTITLSAARDGSNETKMLVLLDDR